MDFTLTEQQELIRKEVATLYGLSIDLFTATNRVGALGEAAGGTTPNGGNGGAGGKGGSGAASPTDGVGNVNNAGGGGGAAGRIYLRTRGAQATVMGNNQSPTPAFDTTL